MTRTELARWTEYYTDRFEAALKNSFMNADDIWLRLKHNEYQMVRASESAPDLEPGFAIIEIVHEGKTRGLHVVIADYPIEKAAEWFERLDRIAADMDAKFMTCTGRMGWEKVFRKYGAVKTGIILRRKL